MRSKKHFFRPFGSQFGLKIRGKVPRAPISWIRHRIQEMHLGELPVAVLKWEEELWEECMMGLKD